MAITGNLGGWFDPVRKGKLWLCVQMRRSVGRRLALARCRPLANEAICSVPFYCISLGDAAARRAFMAAQARRLGLKAFRFIDAVDGRSATVGAYRDTGLYDDAGARECEGRGLTVAEIAVALSHRRAWQAIADQSQPHGIVLEDDAIMGFGKWDVLQPNELPDKWDVCVLEAWLRTKPPTGQVADHIYDLTSYKGGAGAYLLSKAGAVKLLAASRTITHPADGLFVWYNRHLAAARTARIGDATSRLKAFLWWPFPVINGSGGGYWGSSIGTSIIPY